MSLLVPTFLCVTYLTLSGTEIEIHLVNMDDGVMYNFVCVVYHIYNIKIYMGRSPKLCTSFVT